MTICNKTDGHLFKGKGMAIYKKTSFYEASEYPPTLHKTKRQGYFQGVFPLLKISTLHKTKRDTS